MEKSVFLPETQEKELESKIIVALERISEAFRVLLWNESKEFGLSPIQIQILIFINFHAEKLCKVSYLAEEFSLTKATISDSIKVLLQKNLIEKIVDEQDTRSYSIRLTQEGKTTSQKLSLFANTLKKPLNTLSEAHKKDLWNSLVVMIQSLQQANIISLQRMCLNCQNYQEEDNKHFCKLLGQELTQEALRIDCPEHQAIE
ncbi:MAG: MarR family transcriptional regulator [Raineya sp.]|jgi:DNA-binding MarR family transcriptional regulator|nr:MarR family transcriptional regulator [Raineya sp.]